MSEIQRLNKLCAERKEAEDSLRKKWKKIEEFDARRSELESIYNALLKASMVGLYTTLSLSAMHILHSRVICFILSLSFWLGDFLLENVEYTCPTFFSSPID